MSVRSSGLWILAACVIQPLSSSAAESAQDVPYLRIL